MIRVGPAGWSYPDSPGHVYPAGQPKQFDALGYYARFFDTVEINASFYAPQPPRSCAAWVRRVAGNPHFRFTAKLWQRFTHGPPEPWDRADVAAVTDGFAVLREAGRLGAVLAQFPWSFKPGPLSTERLERLAADFAGWPVVVEVRHGAWASRETSLLLKRLGLGFCNIDQPLVGDALGPTAGVTSSVGYVRLHGRNAREWFGDHPEGESWRRYDYLYSAGELAPWLERIMKVAAAPQVQDVYVVANNHFQGQGPANALMLRSMLERRKVPVPPTLYATYERQLAQWGEPAPE